MVVFKNVLSHTSTQKSPKYLNLHKLFAEFYLGFFFFGLFAKTSWAWGQGGRSSLEWLLVRAVALRGSATAGRKGPSPQRVLLGARVSDLPVVTCHWLVAVCTPQFLKLAPDRQACARWSSAAEGWAGRCWLPIFLWPVVVRVDGPKPSGFCSFCSCLRPDFLWALWKTQPFHFAAFCFLFSFVPH